MSLAMFLSYFGWQFLAAGIVILTGMASGGVDAAMALMLGSVIAILPNAYFCLQAFRPPAPEDPVQALGKIYRGETGKIVLVMVFCALTFRFVELREPLLLFVALVVMLIVQPIAAVKVMAHEENRDQDLSKD